MTLFPSVFSDDPFSLISGIGWVILGGESGPGARPMEADWVRSIRDQCGAAGVPFFFKQWGGVRKSKSGRLLDGRTHDEAPEQTRVLPSTAASLQAQGLSRP